MGAVSSNGPDRPGGVSGRAADVRGAVRGVVLEAAGGVYRILDEEGRELDAFLRGRHKRETRTGDRVVAGDRLVVAPSEGGDGWVVEEVEPRDTELVRRKVGGHRPRVVAANVDQVLVVMALDEPAFRPEVADRFLVLAETCRIPAVLVLNKIDLREQTEAVQVEALVEVYEGIGYPVIACSTISGDGLDALAEIMDQRVNVLIGPSGVGKSSLLNALYPDFELRTGEVSRRGGRGRHTTVGSRLLVLDGGGQVVDTPGFSEAASWGVSPEELDRAFPEFHEPAIRCRFRRCSHLHEPDCGVQAAVESGVIDPGRYESYAKLMAESQ